jgi:hypothetical protein
VPPEKYQFLTRSGSGPKLWFFNDRSQRMNVGFFNRRWTVNSFHRATAGFRILSSTSLICELSTPSKRMLYNFTPEADFATDAAIRVS